MDLASYLFEYKVKNPDFRYSDFAKEAGITPFRLAAISSGGAMPSPEIAEFISELTGGKVTPWEILKFSMGKRRQKVRQKINQTKEKNRLRKKDEKNGTES